MSAPADASTGRSGVRAGAPWIALAIALVALGVLAATLDRHEARRLLGETQWAYVLPAVAATAVSYGALSGEMLVIGRVVGLRVPAGILLRAAFVSLAANHVASFGGATGYSLRTVLLQRFGEPPGAVLATSLMHSYLNTVAMIALLPVGLIYLAIARPLSPGGTAAAAIAGTASAVVVAAMTAALVWPRLRRALVAGSARAVHFVLRGGRGDAAARTLADVDAGLGRGTAALRERPGRALAPVALAAFDWAATLVALWFCFEALGPRLPPGVLVTGFAIGVNAGVISLIPGGLGVQEGSMAATFALLGVPIERAALAAGLFRVVYYLVPFAVSLPLSWPLMRGGADPVRGDGDSASDG